MISNPYIAFSTFEQYYHKLYVDVCMIGTFNTFLKQQITFKVQISPNDYISNVFTLKQVMRNRMYSIYGQSSYSTDTIWTYLVWPISTTPVLIRETNSLGKRNV